LGPAKTEGLGSGRNTKEKRGVHRRRTVPVKTKRQLTHPRMPSESTKLKEKKRDDEGETGTHAIFRKIHGEKT